VVASRVGGIPEIVTDGETGYLVPCTVGPEDSDAAAGLRFSAALAGRINQLIADPGLAAELGRAGRRRVLEAFTWEAVASQTVELYRSLTTGAAG
jgi:starch synthase